MSQIQIVQEDNSHMFLIFQDGEQLGKCDRLSAEEFQIHSEEEGSKVLWVYPEDRLKERGRNA